MGHVTFIHGIKNKIAPDALHAQWRRVLFDGVAEPPSSEMVYWADVLYAEPEKAGGLESMSDSTTLDEASANDPQAFLEGLPEAERAWVEAMGRQIVARDEPDGDAAGLERIPLPWFLKRPAMAWLLRDVHHYLFDKPFTPRAGETFAVQQEIRARFVGALGRAPEGRHVVVSHSMGTVIAYDCLKRVDGCPAIDGLVTLGSPLGIDEIQDLLKPEYARASGWPDALRHRWLNASDALDPVCGGDPRIANDFKQGDVEMIEDAIVTNDGLWRHDAVEYLAQPAVRGFVAEALG